MISGYGDERQLDFSREAAILEAILFLEGEPLDLGGLSRISGLSRNVVTEALRVLKEEYDQEIHGIELTELGGAFAFSPKRAYWETLRDRYGRKNDKRLSRAALETLAIIAYSQPVTRAEIEAIRGVSADGMIKLLLERNLIEGAGRKDVPGKPTQYRTTREFLRVFRLSSISDLPKLDTIEEQRFADYE